MTKRLVAVLAALAALATASPARADGGRKLEVMPFVGVWIPIGGGSSEFDTAPLTGLKLAYDVDPHVAVVGTFSWAATAANQLSGAKLDVLQYDLGLRGQYPMQLAPSTTLRPFLGIGVGQSRYEFRDPQYASGPGFAFYSSAGAEIGYRALTAGLDFRHQTQSVDANELGTSKTRQSLELFGSVGLRF